MLVYITGNKKLLSISNALKCIVGLYLSGFPDWEQDKKYLVTSVQWSMLLFYITLF